MISKLSLKLLLGLVICCGHMGLHEDTNTEPSFVMLLISVLPCCGRAAKLEYINSQNGEHLPGYVF